MLSSCTADPTERAPRRGVELADASWTALPDAPLHGGPRRGGALVWTGERALTWGGGEVDFRCGGVPSYSDGAAFDPATGRWQALPTGPLGPRIDPHAHWTGEQLLLVGGHERSFVPGSDVGCQGGPLLDGAAFTPATGEGEGAAGGTWRRMPAPPLPLGATVEASAWTGTELLVWAGREGTAAFDPAAWTWRALASAPQPAAGLPGPDEAPGAGVPQPRVQVHAESAWTGNRWLIWAQVLDADHDATAWPLAYDPGEDAWTPIADAPPEALGRYWDGRRVLALHPTSQSAAELADPLAGPVEGSAVVPVVAVEAYDPDTDEWTRGPAAPEPLFVDHEGDTVVLDGRLLTWEVSLHVAGACPDGGGDGCDTTGPRATYLYDSTAPEDQRWRAVEAGPWEELEGVAAVDTGQGLLVTGGRAGLMDGGSRRAEGPALPAGLLRLPSTGP